MLCFSMAGTESLGIINLIKIFIASFNLSVFILHFCSFDKSEISDREARSEKDFELISKVGYRKQLRQTDGYTVSYLESK